MSQLFIRAYPAELQRIDQHQLTGRLVPYDVVADVLDELPDGQIDVYQEGFRRGAFEPQVALRSKLSKISLVHTHEGGLGYLGPFVALREQPDGLYGDVRVLRSRADDVEDLLEAGVNELSVEFRLPRTGHTEVDASGVRWRTRAHLDRVALEPKGAYTSAQVIAYRTEVDEERRAEAEAAAAADAERQAREAEAAQVAAALVAEADAALERRQRWEELTGRLDGERAKQEQLVRDYGITQPGGFHRQGER